MQTLCHRPNEICANIKVCYELIGSHPQKSIVVCGDGGDDDDNGDDDDDTDDDDEDGLGTFRVVGAPLFDQHYSGL